jgi:cell division septal protein FtsQ
MQDVVKTSVKRQRSSKRKRRRTRRHTAYILLVAVLVVGLGAALSMTLFFNVTDIVVINETDTPDDRIIELSGIRLKDNLVRLDTAIAAETVRANVVYAEKVTVTKQFPSTVQIYVEKAVPVANISQSYGYLLVSASNRVLEELKDAPREGLLVVTGYNPMEGSIGMVLRSEDEKRDNILKTLTAAVSECGNEMINTIDMADQSDIIAYFGENIVFHMGSSSDAVYKLRFASETIKQLNPAKKYKLTMIGNNQISVLPESVPYTDAAEKDRKSEISTDTERSELLE